MSPFVSDICGIPAFQPHPAFPLKEEWGSMQLNTGAGICGAGLGWL